MKPNFAAVSCISLTLLSMPAASLWAQGYEGYPYSIMAPEHGTTIDHRGRKPGRARQESAPPAQVAPLVTQAPHRKFVTRGSSGSVLPTPLPRTPAIPPEGGGPVTIHAPPVQQGPTIVPGAPGLGAVPNLPHGIETFQDRASRCAFQQGLNNVPAGASNQYMGACIQ
ncbi:MAG TPA: hypothetical protein VLX09_06755 [Stellaceae bacterium]|nr:hypothetical protein [Stellaceae bacterium]